MTRLQRARKYYRISSVLTVVSGFLTFLSFMFILGTVGHADLEDITVCCECYPHNLSWYIIRCAAGLAGLWGFGFISTVLYNIAEGWRYRILKYEEGGYYCR